MKLTPNVRALIFRKMALILVPDGGGIASAAAALSRPDVLTAAFREAHQWVAEALAVVKTSPDNPHGDDDEAIAGNIMTLLKEKIAQQLRPHIIEPELPPIVQPFSLGESWQGDTKVT